MNTGSQDPTLLDQTKVEEQETVPSLAKLGDLLPTSTRHLIGGMLGAGSTIDAVVGQVGRYLARVIDWTDAGVPGGKLGTRGEALLLLAVRVLVEDVERCRQPPVRRIVPTPRPSVPRPAPVARTETEELALDGDPSEER
jgi:hypothetical protein